MIEIIRWTASWCGPCLLMNPVFDQIAEEYKGRIIITVIDVDSQQALAKQNNIRSIPTIIFNKNGVMYDKQVGAVPKNVIAEKINKGLL